MHSEVVISDACHDQSSDWLDPGILLSLVVLDLVGWARQQKVTRKLQNLRAILSLKLSWAVLDAARWLQQQEAVTRQLQNLDAIPKLTLSLAVLDVARWLQQLEAVT